ncbi:MAG: hypothetical protein ACFB4J_06555 [Elainellaceae cyanobacterium]
MAFSAISQNATKTPDFGAGVADLGLQMLYQRSSGARCWLQRHTAQRHTAAAFWLC